MRTGTRKQTKGLSANAKKQKELQRLIKKLGIVGWHGMMEGSLDGHIKNLRLIERDREKGLKQNKKLFGGAGAKQRL
jgi:hypothetical protein